jgi:excisionase family DNA binding protein
VDPDTPDLERYIGVDELAPLLGMSEDWVYEHAKAGDLPSYVFPGGRRRFLYSEVREQMARWRQKPPQSDRLGKA